MIILLKCRCTDGEVKLNVRARDKSEDIRDYMDHVTEEVGEWHLRRGCSETKLEYMRIPLGENKGIGQ